MPTVHNLAWNMDSAGAAYNNGQYIEYYDKVYAWCLRSM